MKQLTQSLQLSFLRLTFRVLGWISPKRAASRAMQLMSTPRIFPIKEREQTVLTQATLSRLSYRGGELQLYRWGNNLGPSFDQGLEQSLDEGSRTLLLMHGWEGRVGNYGGLIPRLLADGWSIIAFDAPSHGQSDQQPTSMFDFVDCLNMVLERNHVDAIVAHSFGCVATTIALSQNQNRPIHKLVYIASPNRFEDRLQQIATLFHLSNPIVNELRAQLQDATDYPIFNFTIADLGEQIHVPSRLLLHDRNDQVSLFEWSQEIATAWSQVEGATTQLIPIEGTGHNRILWDEKTIQHVAAFLA